MLNRIEEFIDHLNQQPNANEGFSAKTFYKTGMEFGLTCKEVMVNFLGKHHALARGKYPAVASDTIIALAQSAPVKKVLVAKKVAKRNVSTGMIVKSIAKDDSATLARRDLIASIAKRHSSEDRAIKEMVSSFSAPSSQREKTRKFSDDATIEEFEKLQLASTFNPLSA